MDDYFALLGLPPRYHLDPEALRRSYLQQSRALHPDYFGNATPAEQEQALRRSSLVNQAYRALSDPIARLEHLLRRAGLIDAAGQTTHRLGAAFMMEVMELGEVATEGDAAARAALRAQLDQRIAQQLTDIDALMHRYDEGDSATLADALDLLLQRRALERVRESAMAQIA